MSVSFNQPGKKFDTFFLCFVRHQIAAFNQSIGSRHVYFARNLYFRSEFALVREGLRTEFFLLVSKRKNYILFQIAIFCNLFVNFCTGFFIN